MLQRRLTTYVLHDVCMTIKLPVDVISLSWFRLNEALLKCDDLVVLQQWMEVAITGGDTLLRVLRIHSRLNVVRRTREVKALRLIVGKTMALRNQERKGEETS